MAKIKHTRNENGQNSTHQNKTTVFWTKKAKINLHQNFPIYGSLWVWLMLPLWPLSMGLTYATFMTSVYHPIVYGFYFCYLYDQCLSPHSLWVLLMLPLWPVSITPLSMGLTYATLMTSLYHSIVYGFYLYYLYDQCLSSHSLWVWLMLPLWPLSMGLTYATFMTSVYHPIVIGWLMLMVRSVKKNQLFVGYFILNGWTQQ